MKIPLLLSTRTLLSGMSLAVGLCVLARAQTSRATRALVPLDQVALSPRATTRLVTNSATASPANSVVALRLPQDISRYQVVEQKAQTAKLATNLMVDANRELRTELTPGSTLMFLEKPPTQAVAATGKISRQALFSTFLVKALPPERPGAPQRTASGTLTVLTDVPIPWNEASNAYVGRISVMFLTDDPAGSHPLLPMAVELSGSQVDGIQPRKVELKKAGVEGSEEAVVVCSRYRSGVQVTAFYQQTNTVRELSLQRLGAWDMTQMILPKPLLFGALVGGVLGGWLRLFKQSRWDKRRMVRQLAEGGVVGIVTVTLLLSGLLQTGVASLGTRTQVMLAFALAAVAGSVGAHFLDRTVERLQGKAPANQTAGET